MRITIPKEVITVIEGLGNKTKQKSGMKVYTALYQRSHRADKHGYFYVPSTYLEKVNYRYYTVIEKFIEGGIIKPKETIKPDPTDIFKSIKKATYSTFLGKCKQYKFLVDITQGATIDIDFSSGREFRWYEVIEYSLIQLGYEPKIIRDSFGHRVHHPVIPVYKTELINKGLAVIDARASQPTLLWLLMKERHVADTNYDFVFETNLDFYQYVCDQLQLTDRDAAKALFMFWVNSKGYVPDFGIHTLFPVASNFIKRLKAGNYKDSPAFLQRKEAEIWIDDLLQNIPVEFALPVHDSLIVKQEDLELVLAYCKEKYPDLKFETKLL